ncbi:MAG: hypothetical protein JRH20_15330 [Deltaproteobacteria bacterium]|nr:hypothetical protein [Deltaproteobacteria bacterium]
MGRKREKGVVFGKPYAAICHKGKLFISDTGSHTIHVVDLKRKRFTRLSGDSHMGKLKVPINMAFDSKGSLFVADTGRKEVMVYDHKGRHVRSMGRGLGLVPSGVAIRGEELVVSDVKKHKIYVLNKETGAKIREFGGPGATPGKTSFPTNVALDGPGNIYVSEPITGRVQKFSSQGDLLTTFGSLGKGIGQLVRPKGVAVDSAGRVWIVDAANQHVQIFNKEGKLLLFFGGNTGKPGGLYLPAGIHVSRDKESLAAMDRYIASDFHVEALVVVVSQYGPRRITIYGFGKKK